MNRLKLYKSYFEKERTCKHCNTHYKPTEICYLVVKSTKNLYKLVCIVNCPNCQLTSNKFSFAMSKENAYILKSKMEKFKDNKNENSKL